MFKISVQTGGPEEAYGIDGAYKVIKECGFDAVDANIDHLMSWNDIQTRKHLPIFDGSVKDALPAFKPWKDAAEKYGLDNYQAHAPFPSYIKDGNDYNDYMINVLQKCIAGCDYMNCRNLIVHPFFTDYTSHMSAEEEKELNIRSYAKLIPYAKEYGVTICLENMFSGFRGKVYSAICSDITEACEYIDTLNGMAGEKCFGFCLDTGHLLLVGKDIKKAMVQLGDRICAFHVHDNNGTADQHLAPYMGILDWNTFIDGLKEIKFNRTLSFETFNIWNVVDTEIAPEFMKAIAKTGRMFSERADA